MAVTLEPVLKTLHDQVADLRRNLLIQRPRATIGQKLFWCLYRLGQMRLTNHVSGCGRFSEICSAR